MAGFVLAVAAASCVYDSPTGPTGDEAFLAIIARTEGPAEISAGQRWTLRVRRLNVETLDTTVVISPGDTTVFRLPLDSYDIFLDGVPIACRDRSGLTRRRFLSVADATFVVRFNVFCNTFLALNVATVAARDAEVDQDYVYRLLDEDGGELRLGVLNAVDTVLFDEVQPGAYTMELSHVDPKCLVVSSGGRSRSFVIDPPQVAFIRYQIECSNPLERPRITHFESSYRSGQGVFYLEAVDPDPDGPGPFVPDIDAYHWSITDCERNEIVAVRARTGLSAWGVPTRGADTLRLAVAVPLGLPDSEMAGRCTSIRVTDSKGNSSTFVEERIGDETGSPPVDVASSAFAAAAGLGFQVQATDPDGDFAGSFQRFVFRDGTFGTPDGLPDVLSRNIHGYPVGSVIPSFSFTDFPFTLDDLLGVRMILIDREGNYSELQDEDFTR